MTKGPEFRVVGGFPSDVFWSVEGTAFDPFNFQQQMKLIFVRQGSVLVGGLYGILGGMFIARYLRPPYYTPIVCHTIQSSFDLNGKNYLSNPFWYVILQAQDEEDELSTETLGSSLGQGSILAVGNSCSSVAQ